MMNLYRTLIAASGVVIFLASTLTPASAYELDDVLAEARNSTYTASRLVVSVWGGQTQVVREFVEHANGMEMIRSDAGWSWAGQGKAVAMGEDPSGFTFFTQRQPFAASRYTIKERGIVLHMSRPCRVVDVMEGDVLRASFVVDNRSGAFLVADMFTGSGELFRRTTLSDFRAYRTYAAPHDGTAILVEVVMPEAADLLPESSAGYYLVESFSAPGGAEQGYFTDGLFSFSLFILDARTSVSGFEDPMVLVVESGRYDMVPTASAVSLHWQNGSHRFVLVGDLPPDHLADVLSELPPPRTRGMWARWWNRLFG